MLRIYLLGDIHIEAESGLFKLPSAALSLWAYLLLHRHAPILRDTLAQTLWPDAPEAEARAKLSRQLYRLRSALPLTPADQPWLLTTATTVQWNPNSPFWLDVQEFEHLSASPATMPAAVEGYGGDLLPGIYDDWLLYERERLRHLYLADLEQLVQGYRANHDYRKSIEYARRLLNVEPLHEAVLRQLMAACYQLGDRASALAEYERFSRRLAAELDAPPMPETIVLYETIAHNLPLPGSAATTGVTAASRQEGAETGALLPFVGRSQEMAQLEGAWRRAAQGQGGLVLIGGEAGAGKSRLCLELAAQVEAEGGRLLYGGSSEDEKVPYQALVNALRTALPLLLTTNIAPPDLRAILPLLPELARRRPDLVPLPRLEPERERTRLHYALVGCLNALAAARPTLLILEDLHWADHAILDFLPYLMRRLTNSRLLLLATYRDEEAGRSQPLRDLLAVVRQDEASLHLSLPSLNAQAVAQLAQRVPALAANEAIATELYNESEGNPFFLSELIWSRLEKSRDERVTAEMDGGRSLPERLAQLISSRTARLRANTRLLAEVAAVVGVNFNLEVVREVAGWSEAQASDALNELLDRRIARDVGGADYAFAHHLIHESIYGGIDPLVRGRRHQRLALVLEEFYPERLAELAAELARHFDLGGSPARAVFYYLRAADRALAVYADDEARAATSRALELSEDPRSQFEALALRESIYHRHGNHEAQAADLARMAEIGEELNDDELICETLHREALLARKIDTPEREEELIAKITNHADSAGSRRWQAVALHDLGSLRIQRGQLDVALVALEDARQIYKQLGDKDAEVRCYALMADCASQVGDYQEVRHLLSAAEKLITPNNQALLAYILRCAAVAAIRQRDLATTHMLATQLLAICQITYDHHDEAAAHDLLADVADYRQHFDEALDHKAQALQFYVAVGNRRKQAWNLLNTAIVFSYLGRRSPAFDYLHQAQDIFVELHDLHGQLFYALNSTAFLNGYGDYAAARQTVEKAFSVAAEISSPFYHAVLLGLEGEAELGLAEFASAHQHITEAITTKRTMMDSGLLDLDEDLYHLIIANLLLGNLAAAQKCRDELLSVYQTSVEQIEKPHRIFWIAACVEHCSGDLSGVQEYLSQAYTLLQQKLQEIGSAISPSLYEEWRTNYLQSQPNRAIIAAYERDEWPAYTNPGYAPATERPPACSHCQSESTIKAGLNPSGSQRYRCQACHRYFTAAHKPMGHDAALREQAIRLHQQGESPNSIARALGVSRRSVSNWLKAMREL